MAREVVTQVRAKVAHIQPGELVYREKGEEFPHTGKLYKHVEPAGKAQPAEEKETEETGEES